jgi:protein TonB
MTRSRLTLHALRRAFLGAAIVHVAASACVLLLHGARREPARAVIQLLTPTHLQPPPSLSPGGGGLRVENVGPTQGPDADAAMPVPVSDEDVAPSDEVTSSAPASTEASTGGSGGGTGGGTGTGSGAGAGSGEGGRIAPPEDVIEAPRLRSFVQPDYPASARKKGVAGSVVLHVHVREDGRVDSVTIARGLALEELNAKAVETAYQVSFDPARRNGVAIDAWVPYTVTFSLDKR